MFWESDSAQLIAQLQSRGEEFHCLPVADWDELSGHLQSNEPAIVIINADDKLGEIPQIVQTLKAEYSPCSVLISFQQLEPTQLKQLQCDVPDIDGVVKSPLQATELWEILQELRSQMLNDGSADMVKGGTQDVDVAGFLRSSAADPAQAQVGAGGEKPGETGSLATQEAKASPAAPETSGADSSEDDPSLLFDLDMLDQPAADQLSPKQGASANSAQGEETLVDGDSSDPQPPASSPEQASDQDHSVSFSVDLHDEQQNDQQAEQSPPSVPEVSEVSEVAEELGAVDIVGMRDSALSAEPGEEVLSAQPAGQIKVEGIAVPPPEAIDHADDAVEKSLAPDSAQDSLPDIPLAANISELTKESQAISHHHDSELLHLKATIESLREDREMLAKKLEAAQKDQGDVKYQLNDLQAALDEAKIEAIFFKKRYQEEVQDLNYRVKMAQEQKSILQEKNKQLKAQVAMIKGRVSFDVRKVQGREKTLESQLELLKLDSQNLLQSRDQKILELKQKIDSLEFDLETAAEKEKRAREDKYLLEDRLERVMRTLRRAIASLDEELLAEKSEDQDKQLTEL